MFNWRKKDELSNRDMQPGQTLFQYLKRKKHIALKQSLQNQFHKDLAKQKSFIQVKQNEIVPKQIQVKQSARLASTKRRSRKSSNKKKKADHSSDSRKQNNSKLSNLTCEIFGQQKTARRSFLNSYPVILEVKNQTVNVRTKTPTRSFISMISPLKNHQDHSPSQITITKAQQQNKSIDKASEIKMKKMIKGAMTKVQSSYNEQVSFERQIRQKLRNFFILLNSVLVQLQDMGQQSVCEGLGKKLNLLRSNMKLVNAYILNRQNPNNVDISQMINCLYASINQSLDSMQGQIKASSQHGWQQQIKRLKQQHQSQIDQLIKQQSKLSKELILSHKTTQKTQNQYNKLLDKYNQLQAEAQQTQQQKKTAQKRLFQCLQQKVRQFAEQNQGLKERCVNLDRKLKDAEHRFQQLTRKGTRQHEEKLSERQGFLLREINLLKGQCVRDIRSLTQYNANKQDKLALQVKALQQTICEQKLTIGQFTQSLTQAQNLLKTQESNTKQSKAKAQYAMIDLYKMNQELFKHWSALKDVKILLGRLKMFDKFERIYKDIPFDQLLFNV